jgi:translation initiation factor IF-2
MRKAKLYLGFSVKLNTGRGEDSNAVAKATVKATPQAYVRESVLDYVRLRRGRGATANAIVRNLLAHRNKVVVAPSGNYGSIVDVISKKVGSHQVSDTDSRTLVEFWKADLWH